MKQQNTIIQSGERRWEKIMLQRSPQTVVCRADCQVDRRASHCQSRCDSTSETTSDTSTAGDVERRLKHLICVDIEQHRISVSLTVDSFTAIRISVRQLYH